MVGADAAVIRCERSVTKARKDRGVAIAARYARRATLGSDQVQATVASACLLSCSHAISVERDRLSLDRESGTGRVFGCVGALVSGVVLMAWFMRGRGVAWRLAACVAVGWAIAILVLAGTARGVGSRESRAAVAAARAAHWSLQRLPKPAHSSEAELSGVSCASSTACVAVGGFDKCAACQAKAVFPLAERWDGSSWSILPNPAGSKNHQLNGVSCTSRSACTAVGVSYHGPVLNPRGSSALVERWNGISWSVQRTVQPRAGFVELDGVSCVTRADCVAVGYFVTQSGGGPLMERWDGSKWSTVSIPSAAEGVFKGVSCVSRTDCVAVGSWSGGTLIARRNGAHWSVVHGHQANEENVPELRGVSCTSRRACLAVGNTGGGNDAAIVERWNGARWSQPTSPGGTLDGVSCTSAVHCVAAGYPQPEGWNGQRWSNERFRVSADFMAVSCTSATACVAVGANPGGQSAVAARLG